VRRGVIEKLHPEMGAGGFTAYDGTVAFYARIDAVLSPTMTVLDFGAGRGAWVHDETSDYRKKIRSFRGRVLKVIGCDVDPVVLSNPSLDEAFVLETGNRLSLPDSSIDLIVADYVAEHIEDPPLFAKEINRLLSPGGWFCARTPSKYHYVSIISSMLPSRLGQAAIKRAQPERKREDVFPAFYRLNTLDAIARHFPASVFENCSYVFSFEPQYHFESLVVYRSFKVLHRLLPASMTGNLFVFIRKREVNSGSTS
jgi:SAM-dependent methyltransferase